MPLTEDQRARVQAMLDKMNGEYTIIEDVFPVQEKYINREPKVFISYRRLDSSGYVNHIYDLLVREHKFKTENIFRDIVNIDLGVDFVEVIQSAVQQSTVLLAVIGPQWVSISDDKGRRLDNPLDLVRLEIATAFKLNIRLIPVLVGRASMPVEELLPEDIKGLARRNALEILDRSFRSDVEILANAIRQN